MTDAGGEGGLDVASVVGHGLGQVVWLSIRGLVYKVSLGMIREQLSRISAAGTCRYHTAPSPTISPARFHSSREERRWALVLLPAQSYLFVLLLPH